MSEKEFDVALSFAGEDREHASALASLLKRARVRVFYDEFYKATLWGKDLYQHLQTVYRDKANYCVVFVSKNSLKRIGRDINSNKRRHGRSRRKRNMYFL